MNRLKLTRSLFDREITAEILVLEQGVHVSLYGGELPHIGAVSVVSPTGDTVTHQFPAHKEGVVSQRWAKALFAAGFRPVVVEAGIHYDHLSQAGIAAVMALSEQMLAEALETLSGPPETEANSDA